MGEGVVSGHTDVDNYQLTRMKELIDTRINNKPQVLSEDEMNELVDLAIRLEKEAGSPSDIEWGYKNSKLFLFQIRPITRTFEPLTYFVDTNLSESYPGVVSPFTASFVKKAYENVFKESAVIMGAKGKRLEILSYHYARLISSVDDHLYYNLEHYYAVLRALPGGEKNIENWHKMIGGNIEGSQIPYHETELSKLETIQTLFSLVKIGLGKKSTYSDFLKDLDVMKGEIELRSKNMKSSAEAIHYLNDLINRPIGFGLTVVNDVFIMMGLGILTKILKKKDIPEDQVIDLLKTTEGVDSTKPLEHFNHMVQKLSVEFIQAFVAEEAEAGFDPFTEVFKRLRPKFAAETGHVEEFLNLYGDRSFEELKLESLPLKNNPSLLKELIVWAKKNPSVSSTHTKKEVNIKLSALENKVLTFTREAIAMREATRLWRGKFYHLLRQLVLNLSEQLKNEDTSWKNLKITDFFSLTPSEWKEFAEGKLPEAQKIIIERRGWQTKKRQYPEVIPWVESEPLPGMEKINTGGAISGQGVSPGITEGVALVLENPQDALNSEYKDFILVTKNTDPAWVYIMSRSLGLISEKGSLLSHTAIIGRELNIPTIVGVRMATLKIKSGDRLRIDAGKGTIEIL
jgi:pyruvate,water dikinase